MYEYEKKKLKNYLGDKTYDLLKKHKCIIAGGFILSLFSNSEINDIDIYFRSKEDLSDLLHNNLRKNWVLSKTDKALLVKHVKNDGFPILLQFIYFRYFNNANEIFDTFDFTVCMGAYDFETEEFILHEDFLRNNVSKILRFNSNTAYPIMSAIRVQKYIKKGYSISKSEYIKIMLTIMKLEINSYEELKEQMGGMYGENYDDLLNPPENNEFDLNYIIDNISKIGEIDSDYTRLESGFEVDNWEDFIDDLLDNQIECFLHNGIYFRLRHGELEIVNEFSPKKYVVKDINEIIQFPITLYKLVQKINGKYYSFYDRKYEWVIGENVPKKKENAVYACMKEEIKYSCYYDPWGKGNVCLEVRCESIDDIFVEKNTFNYYIKQNAYHKLTAVRELSTDEFKQIIQDND